LPPYIGQQSTTIRARRTALLVAASLLIAAVMLRAAFLLLRDSGRVFMEAAPSSELELELAALYAAQTRIRFARPAGGASAPTRG